MRNLINKQKNCLVAVLMLVVMSVSLVMPAKVFAAENYTLTLKNDGKTDHEFEVYQIFKGELSGSTLSNIQWGDGIKASSKAGLGDANAKAKTLTDTDKAQAFANTLQAHLDPAKKKTKTVAAGQTGTLGNLEPGYYLIKDKADSQTGNNSAYTLYMLKIVKNTEARTKLDVPTVVKKVQENSDGEWQDAADYGIGDTIPYKLTGTLPANYDKYEKYTYKFHDEMSAGLTLKADSIKVKIDGVLIPASRYTVTTNAATNGFTVAFDDLKTITETPVTKDSKIVVEYSCILNNNAVIGSGGNPNTVYLEYSNNPNKGGEGDHGTTPKDKNIVFTYKVVVNKKDDANNPLQGAEFELYKKVGTNEVKMATFTLDGTKTVFTFKGLDAGSYVLKETKTPSGYNTIKPIEFTITATYDKESDDPKLTKLEGTTDLGTITFTADKTAGSVATDVINNKGFVLPETGGMGRVLIYGLGSIFVLGALGYLGYKKREAAK